VVPAVGWVWGWYYWVPVLGTIKLKGVHEECEKEVYMKNAKKECTERAQMKGIPYN